MRAVLFVAGLCFLVFGIFVLFIGAGADNGCGQAGAPACTGPSQVLDIGVALSLIGATSTVSGATAPSATEEEDIAEETIRVLGPRQ